MRACERAIVLYCYLVSFFVILFLNFVRCSCHVVNRKVSIIALQETKCDRPSVALWEEDWRHQSVWSAGSRHSKGRRFPLRQECRSEDLGCSQWTFSNAIEGINSIIFQLICIYCVTASTQACSLESCLNIWWTTSCWTNRA